MKAPAGYDIYKPAKECKAKPGDPVTVTTTNATTSTTPPPTATPPPTEKPTDEPTEKPSEAFPGQARQHGHGIDSRSVLHPVARPRALEDLWGSPVPADRRRRSE